VPKRLEPLDERRGLLARPRVDHTQAGANAKSSAASAAG
jgi:hypothetical protein